MTGNGRYHGRIPNVAAGVSDLTHDVIELSELQVQLLSLDVKQSVNKARTCLIMAIAGASVLLGTIPVALLALAAVLVEQLEWSVAGATATAGTVGLLIAGVVLGVAYMYVKNGLVSLDRSREEFRRNISWLKSTLRTRGNVPHRSEQPLNF
jgi:ABC-type Fe3+ transport system permease subunit